MGEDWARPVVHWDIRARDPQRQRQFYAALFGWKIEDGFIMGISPGLGGPEPGPAGHIQPAQDGEAPGMSLYVQVRDLVAAIERVVELGGERRGEPFDVPGGPTIAEVGDPEGNALVLVQQ